MGTSRIKVLTNLNTASPVPNTHLGIAHMQTSVRQKTSRKAQVGVKEPEQTNVCLGINPVCTLEHLGKARLCGGRATFRIFVGLLLIFV